jgi:hypothetical protein
MIDEATFQRFGYHLKDVAPGSHKKVVCYCPKCEQCYETQRRYYRNGRLCLACNSRQLMNSNRDAQAMMKTIQAHNKASREKGLSPRGLPLFPGSEAEYKKLHQEANRDRYNASQRKRRQTLIGKVSNRLRVALRTYLQGKGGFSLLPYTPAELQAHIQGKLEEHQYLCPMCSTALEDGFDIDHRTPLSSAKTVEEVIVLFALSNLDVLCPPCNQHKKRAKLIMY